MPVPCDVCRGTGSVDALSPFGRPIQADCDYCDGDGNLFEQWELLKRVCLPRPDDGAYRGMSDDAWKLFADAIRDARRNGNIDPKHEWLLAGMLSGEAPVVEALANE
jgi:hypothetical protein